MEKLKRVSVPELDAILGEKLPVLDDGWVRVVDYMGSDASVVQAARVSYGKGTKRVHEDRGLIRYLMRHRHTTPFEMCAIKFHVRVPMDCWRQWIRHRTASVNEYSTRYSIAIDAALKTKADRWRLQAKGNRQGSQGFLDQETGRELTEKEKALHEFARAIYEERLAKGVAREQARKDLPLSTYTEAYWKIDLHNLLHFLELRMHADAQWEISEYARVIGFKVVARWVPLTWEAFLDYRWNALVLTDIERKLIKTLIAGNEREALSLARACGWLEEEEGRLKRNRERTECEQKLANFGLVPPWQKKL